MGLVDQARECKRQQREDQIEFDIIRAHQAEVELRLAHKNRIGKIRGAETIHRFYKDKIHQIDVLLIGRPNYAPKLIAQKLDLLERLLNATEYFRARQKIVRRIREAECHLARLTNDPTLRIYSDEKFARIKEEEKENQRRHQLKEQT